MTVRTQLTRRFVFVFGLAAFLAGCSDDRQAEPPRPVQTLPTVRHADANVTLIVSNESDAEPTPSITVDDVVLPGSGASSTPVGTYVLKLAPGDHVIRSSTPKGHSDERVVTVAKSPQWVSLNFWGEHPTVDADPTEITVSDTPIGSA